MEVKKKLTIMRKLWLDDIRPEPVGWVRAKTASQAVILLATGTFGEISLDHDLGPDFAGDGCQVISWLEEQIALDPNFFIPIVNIHTANPAAKTKMLQALENIKNFKSLRSKSLQIANFANEQK